MGDRYTDGVWVGWTSPSAPWYCQLGRYREVEPIRWADQRRYDREVERMAAIKRVVVAKAMAKGKRSKRRAR